MRPNEKTVNRFLWVIQGVGTVFVSLFLAAYLAGLPSTAVLHSEPIFRIPLLIFGVFFIILILGAVILAIFLKDCIDFLN